MKRSMSSRFPKSRFAQDRPAVPLSGNRYLFEKTFPSKKKDDDELSDVCRSVIELECHNRILGSRKQDPVAVLNAATEQSSMSDDSDQSILDHFNQFYHRIRPIDALAIIT